MQVNKTLEKIRNISIVPRIFYKQFQTDRTVNTKTFDAVIGGHKMKKGKHPK